MRACEKIYENQSETKTLNQNRAKKTLRKDTYKEDKIDALFFHQNPSSLRQVEDKMETEPRLETAEEDEGSSIEVEPNDQDDDDKGPSEKSAKLSKPSESKEKNESDFLSDNEKPDAAKPEENETAEELEDANDKEVPPVFYAQNREKSRKVLWYR